MRTLLENAIVSLLNGDQDKAEALFHKFMVERARTIHESLRQGDDVELAEGWDNEITEEEYFDGDDMGDDSDDLSSVEDGADVDAPAADADMTADADADAADADADAIDADADAGDMDAEAEDVDADVDSMEEKIDSIDDKLAELTAQFDQLMAEFDEGDDGDLDDIEDMDADAPPADDMPPADTDDVEPEPHMDGGEKSDLADQMEDDMGDEKQPEHEMAEGADMGDDMADDDDEYLSDITESVLAELDKIAIPANSEGKEIGTGRTISGNHDSMLPHHSAGDRVSQAKPVMVKGGNNDSFERETPPSNKEVKRRRNNDAGVKKLKPVAKNGDGGALLNKDFAGGRPATQSIVDGKKSK